MASSSGTSSGSSLIPNSGSEPDLRAATDQRKKKRMLSNRESARRSRMRKQKHLDDLAAQVAQLRSDNGQILAALGVTAQHCLGVQAENSVLRTQMAELSNRLQSLDEILHYVSGLGSGLAVPDGPQPSDDGVTEPWNLMMMMDQPIMASADLFHYC